MISVLLISPSLTSWVEPRWSDPWIVNLRVENIVQYFLLYLPVVWLLWRLVSPGENISFRPETNRIAYSHKTKPRHGSWSKEGRREKAGGTQRLCDCQTHLVGFNVSWYRGDSGKPAQAGIFWQSRNYFISITLNSSHQPPQTSLYALYMYCNMTFDI